MSEKTEAELASELQGGESGKSEGEGSGTSSRARNRTVMLTPEITGQVRSMLGGEGADSGERPDPLADLLPPLSGDFSARQQSPRPSEALAASTGEEERDPTGKFQTSIGNREANPEPVAVPSFSVNSQAVAPAPAPAASGSRVVSASPRSKIVGFLISFDADENGDVYEVRAGRWLLTSRPTDHGDYILIDDSTISPLHAIVRATGKGVVQVLDQLSEFGTGVTRSGETEEEEVTGAMAELSHGDQVRFGERHFIFCLVPEVSAADDDSKKEK